MATVKIEVELDASGAITGIRGLDAGINLLPSSAKKASSAVNELADQQKRAQDAAQLLGNQLGVKLPRAVEGFISKTKLIGPALSAAFNASVYLALAAALVEVLTNMDAVTDKLVDWTGEMKKAREETERLNKVMLDHVDALKRINESNALIGLTGSARTKAELGQRGGDLADLLSRQADLTKQLGALRARAAGFQVSEELSKLTPEQVAKGIAAINQELGELAPKISAAAAVTEGLAKQLKFDQIEEGKRRLEELQRKLDEIAEKAARAFKAETALDPASLTGPLLKDLQSGTFKPPTGPATVFDDTEISGRLKPAQDLIDKFETLRKQNSQLAIQVAEEGHDFLRVQDLKVAAIDHEIERWKEDANIVRELEKQKQLVIQETSLKAADYAKERFEKVSGTIEQFFDRVFLSAKSFGDVWKQLWLQMVSYVIKQIARMAAAWWLAHRTMSGSPAGVLGVGGGGAGGAGGSAAALSGLLGGGGGGGGGFFGLGTSAAGGGGGFGGFGTPPFIPTSPGTTGSTGTGGVSRGTAFLTSLKSLAPTLAGLAGFSVARLGVAKGSPLLGGIGGFFAGGAAGLGLASLGVGAGTAFGAFLGPIGAGVGALVGIFLAARARGKQKTLSARLHEDYLDAAKKAVDDFERHKLSYDQAVSKLGTIYDSTVEALRAYGTPGRRTIDEIKPKYEASLKRLEDLQRIREGRVTAIGKLPIPTFASGGFVRGQNGEPVLLMAHAGEAVLNQKATAELGADRINRLNRGSSEGGPIHITINAIDGPSVDRFIRSNGRRFTKWARQQARDRGKPIPF